MEQSLYKSRKYMYKCVNLIQLPYFKLINLYKILNLSIQRATSVATIQIFFLLVQCIASDFIYRVLSKPRFENWITIPLWAFGDKYNSSILEFHITTYPWDEGTLTALTDGNSTETKDIYLLSVLNLRFKVPVLDYLVISISQTDAITHTSANESTIPQARTPKRQTMK